MNLLTKFNLILLFVLGLGFFALSTITHDTLQQNARSDVIARAGLMMDSAGAVRSYTVDEIRPLLKLQMKRAFLPQTVPAYAATQAFLQLQQHNAEYMYKEATLNPTNPRDRAVDWEADIISLFRNRDDLTELSGERDTPTGRSQYLARPIRITNAGCLVCHSVPDAAPQTMIDKYGTANGFGWQHNEVVGAQIVSVPLEVALQQADATYQRFMVALTAVFVAIVVLLNFFLYFFVVRPVRRMSKTAEAISMGDMSAPEFSDSGRDELSVLGASFNRMRRSIENAMEMIGGK
ncbi:MAG: DUF3365 domain-containing protein [Gammaproteobacteria bacterium]|nr:DUF3365 domain-containing protein [Gammaproteobacteria bacterium]